MIIKVKTRRTASFKQLINYMAHNDERFFDESSKSFLLTHNLKGKSFDSWVKQFKENESYRKYKRPDSVVLSHEILSWHRKDSEHLSLEKLKTMTEAYIRLRGIRGMYLAVPHVDSGRNFHVHICASGVEFHTGKSMRMSRSGFAQLKSSIQAFEKSNYPELSHSVVEHGKSAGKKRRSITDEEFQIKLRTQRSTHVETITGILNECFNSAKSPEAFYGTIQGKGLEPYVRGGRVSGVVYLGRKFRLNKLGYPKERVEELDRLLSLRTVREKGIDRKLNRNR